MEYSVEHPQTKLQEEGPMQSKSKWREEGVMLREGTVITNTSLTPNYVWGITL